MKLNKTKLKKVLQIIVLGFLYIVTIGISTAWILVPLFVNLGSPALFPQAWFLPVLLNSVEASKLFIIISYICIWLHAPIVLWKLIAPFLHKKLNPSLQFNGVFVIIGDIIASTSIVIVYFLHIITFADKEVYFQNYPWFSWIYLAITIIWNAVSLSRLLSWFALMNPDYRRYREFRERVEQESWKFRAFLRRWGIQRRLTFVFSAVLIFIITVLVVILLRDFSRTLTISLEDTAFSQAEQTANTVRTIITDKIALDDYFSIQRIQNDRKKTFKFDSLTFYQRTGQTNSFKVVSSTDGALIGSERQVETVQKDKWGRVKLDANKQIEFRSDVILAGKQIGYIALVYNYDSIYGQFYKTRAKVITIALIFIYFSIFAIYWFGRTIVYPILFLRVGVYEIASKLTMMIKGTERIGIEDLRYEDRITTRDEIKNLSTEISNMTNVIRGIIPYISTSTLKASEKGSPSTERKDLAFLFTDIRGFTSLCEGRNPEDIVNLLNHYLSLQTDIIIKHGGDIDKFVGDELMAFFEGQDKEKRACLAALALKEAMAQEAQKAIEESKTPIAIGIGINSGTVTFGSVGARNRMDFTSIGDTVNLAARLEGTNKLYGTAILISEMTYKAVQDYFLCREIDLITVKGKSIPVRIYEVLATVEQATKAQLTLKKNFELGLKKYYSRDWDGALEVFTKVYDQTSDEPSAVFIDRIRLYKKNPPPQSWDGVFNIKVK